MRQFLLGALLGISVAATGAYLYLGMQTPPPVVDCGGVCGEGTACVEGRCELVEPELEIPVEDEKTGKKRKKKRKPGSGGEAEGEGEGEAELGGGTPWTDDSKVPRFDPDADQVIGASEGSERLGDATIDRELAELDDDFQACVREANDRVAELGTGKVSYSFGIAPSGKVTGVNASAPQNLKDAGVIPCVRKAVYEHRFPSYDGPPTKASSSFSVR